MDKKKILKKSLERKPKYTKIISIRVTKEMSKWLMKNDYSPTGIFREACKELGYKETKD